MDGNESPSGDRSGLLAPVDRAGLSRGHKIMLAVFATVFMACLAFTLVDELRWRLFKSAHSCMQETWQTPAVVGGDIRYEDARWTCDDGRVYAR